MRGGGDLLFARTYGAATQGVDGLLIDVEVDASAGLPGFDLVGLPDTAVRESKERVRTAIRNSGIRLKQEKVTINLAPAGIRKDSPGLDLPMAVGLLAAYGIVPTEKAQGCLFAAELSLEGECRGISGILPMAVCARENGIKAFFVAKENAREALLVEGLCVYAVANLGELVAFLRGDLVPEPAKASEENADEPSWDDDFADVQGQFQAKRALEIAAAGGHNLLMVGVPGSGKTMLARRLNTILPPLTREEALEVTKIYSIAGMLPKEGGLVTRRPFRSPHHTISTSAMIGGGSIPRPGEVTLAHHGVLFLDELPEFSKRSLEVLREPLEDHQITISRAQAKLTFPSSFMMIAAMNPCPCGFYGDATHPCDCTPGEIKRYTRRLSGPLLDRVDLQIRVSRVEYKDLSSSKRAESSDVIRERVIAARSRQINRLRKHGLFCNAQMNHQLIRRYAKLDRDALKIMEFAFEQYNLSARSFDRIAKVARTIADLDGKDTIEAGHVAEAVQLRNEAGTVT